MLLNRSRFPLADLRDMGRLFDLFGPTESMARPFPAMNLWEDGDALYLETEVPGLTMDALDLSIQGAELSLRGRRADGGENVTFHRRERGIGEFARFLTLPVEVDADRVEATLKDGVLRVMMPKSERAKARKIQVRSA